MASSGWTVHYTSRDVARPDDAPPSLRDLPGDLASWLDDEGIPDGLPFLLSPRFEYDWVLNSFFHRPQLLTAPWNSNANRALALARFFNFLEYSRGGVSWRAATEADHLAFHYWRRRDAAGPRVAGATWSQEVAHVNQFYVWALRQAQIGAVPIPHRARRPPPAGSVRRSHHLDASDTVPATYAHDERGQRVEWLPPQAYRRWRDVGLRGYGPDGLPDSRFKGRWAARNATFTDLMVRTGMRLAEQASLTMFEVPVAGNHVGYQRFWLPGTVAKYFSARWIYVPHSLVLELAAYAREDRAEVVARAREAGLYQRWRRPLVVEDPARPLVWEPGQAGSRHRVKVSQLDCRERRRLLIDTPDGLEPAMFWLGEDGMPLAVSTWKSMFADANTRCRGHGLNLLAHAHLLRHSFAVITLEQLQRGHIAALAEFTAEQRGHYTRIFGDPLDWVRRRLGHRSVLTTVIYLHALQELEMHTRMALVPDTWEDPRDTPLQHLAGEVDIASAGIGQS